MAKQNDEEVLGWLTARLARGPASTDVERAWDHISGIVVAGVISASTQARSRRLMRLAEDVDANREQSVLGRILAGEIDVVHVFSDVPEIPEA